MGYDSLISHYQAHEIQYVARIFVIGFANSVQIHIFTSFLLGFAFNESRLKDYLQFMIFLEGVAVLAGFFNAKFLLTLDTCSTNKTFTCIEVLTWVGFITIYSSIELLPKGEILLLSSLVCLVGKISLAIGNATNYGELKSLPQELCKAYNVGLASANFIPIVYILILQSTSYSSDTVVFFLPMCLFVIAKYCCQNWFRKVMLEHQQHDNVFKLRRKESRTEGESN